MAVPVQPAAAALQDLADHAQPALAPPVVPAPLAVPAPPAVPAPQAPQPVEVAEGPQEQLNEVPYSAFRFLVFSFVRVSFVGLLVFCLHMPYSYRHGACRFLYVCLFQKYLFAYAACRLWFTLASMSGI